MKISKLIKKLESLKDKHGDLDMYSYRFNAFIRLSENYPIIVFKKILKGRESKPSQWHTWDGKDRKGDKVCEI